MEVGHLGELVLSMLQNSKSENINLKQVSASRLVKSAHDAELLSAEILSYSRKISYASLSEESHHELEHLLDVTNQLRGVSDTIANNLGTLVKEWRAAQLDASDDTRSRIQSIHLQVTRALRDALTAVQERDYDAANRVIRIKHALHTEIDELGTYLGSRLRSHDPNRVEVYRLESRVLEIERRIYYFAKRIAKTVVAEKESPQKGSIADPDDGIPLS
jgi:phosphate:Na+ symporter